MHTRRLRDSARASQEAQTARRGGPEQMPGVQDAKKSLEDAERAATRANRGIETAKRNAAEAATGTETAAAKLNYLLAQLSPAEKRLYNAMTRLQTLFREGVYRDITDVLVNSFARSIEKITKILERPDIINVARRLAQGMATQFNRITDAFTGNKMIAQFKRIAEQGRANLQPLGTIIIRLGKALVNIAEEAGPSLNRFLRFVSGLAGEFLKLTNQKGKMTDFFSTGEKHFEAWIKLGLSVIRLFMALAGAGGARSGLKSIQDATKAIDGLSDKVAANREKVAEFFEDARKITYRVVDVLVALAEEMAKIWTPDRIDKFAKLLTDVVIPALGDVVRITGNAVQKLVEFADTPIGEKILKGIVAFIILNRIIGGLIGSFRLLGGPFKFLGSVMFEIAKHSGVFARIGTALVRMAPVLGRFALFASIWLGIAVAVGLLLHKLGLLDEAWEAVKGGFEAMWKQIEPPLKRLIEAWGAFMAAVKAGEGPLGFLLDVLRPVLRVLIAIAGVILKEIGKAIGQVLGGVIDIIAGFINVVTALLTGDWARLWEGVKDILRGAANIIIGIVTLVLFRGIGAAFKLGFRGLVWVGRTLIDLFWSALKAMPGLFLRGFRAAIELSWNFLKRFPGRVAELAKDVASFFGRGFRRIGSIIRNAVDDAWQWLKKLPGRFWDLAKDIVSSFWRGYRNLGRRIRGAVEDAWDWLKRLPGRMWELAKDVVSSFWRGYRRMGYYLRKGIEDVWDWLKGLPNRLAGIAKDAVRLFADAFKGLGGKIVDVISEGAGGAAKFSKKIANGLFKLIEDGWNKTIGGKGVGPFKIPKLDLPELATGGPIPGGFGGGDSVLAMLEPGEHVWTKEEVRAAGGQRAMYALRAFFGGGGQSRGPGFRDGGATAGASAGNLTITFKGGNLDDFRSEWRGFWNELLTSARRGTNSIQDQFREMRVSTSRSVDLMYRRVREAMDDLERSFSVRGKRIVSSWTKTWGSLKSVAYDGLLYVAQQTNKALKGLDEKTINFGLSPPKKDGKAGGGFIGGKGQRGYDRGLYSLGAGEAVLNWGHQKYVEPAMQSTYGFGLQELFSRTRGYHAGGPEQGGFAKGGMVPIKGMPNEFIHSSIASDVQYIIKHYKAKITDGYAPTGHAADGEHPKGLAVDIVPQGNDWGLIDRLAKAAGWKPGAPSPGKGPFRWIGWNTESGHGSGNHLHLSWLPGKHFHSAGDVVTEISKRLVTGPDGAMKTFVQSSLDKVLKVANKYIEKIYGESAEGAEDVPVGKVGAGAGPIFKFFRDQGFSDAQAAAWVGNFQQESGLRPSAIQPNGQGHGLAQWGDGRWAALQAYAKTHKKPWTDMGLQLSFVMHELKGPESAAYSAIKGAKTIEAATNAIGSKYERYGIKGDRSGPARDAYQKFAGKYEAGGIVPGPLGAPVPILAHAREWILNEGQVNRLAGMMGLSRDALRSMMGFYGGQGPGGAQGGTEVRNTRVLQIGDSLSVGMQEGLKKLVKQLTSYVKEGRGSDEAFKILKDKLTSSFKAVIFDVGTNDAHASVLTKNLKRAYGLLAKDQELIVSRVRGPGAKEKNKAIEEFAKENERVRVVSAAKGKDLAGDDIHLTTQGYKKRAAKFADAIKKSSKATDEAATDAETIVALTEAEVKKISNKHLRRVVVRLRAVGEHFNEAAVRLGDVGTWSRYVNRFTSRLAAVSKRVTKRLSAGDAEKGLRSFVDAMDAMIGENGVFEKLRASIERRTATAARQLVRRRFTVGAGRRITQTRDEEQQARDALVQQRRERGYLVGERTDISTSLRQVTRQLRRKGLDPKVEQRLRAEQQKLKGMLDEADQRVADNLASIYDAQQAYFQAQLDAQQKAVDAINTRYERATGAQERVRRVGEALGRDDLIDIAANAQRDLLSGQASELEARIAYFRNIGTEDANAAADQLADQVADLRVQVFESIQQQIADAADRINTAAQRRMGRLDLGGRMLDAVGAVGLGQAAGVLGENFTRGGLFAQRGGVLQQQRAGLTGVLGVAQAQGNIRLIQDLTDQIAELDVAIQENTKAYFDARVTEVTARHDYTDSMIDLRLQLVDLDGTISGQIDQAEKVRLLGLKQADLAAKGIELQALLNEAYATGNIQAQQDLEKAMLENTIAQRQNTQATNEASGAMQDPQSWSSSGWQWFREAVFSGMGQVLPQYDQSQSVFNSGAVIAGSSSSSYGGDTNITINEAGGPVDIQAVTSAITFASKTAQ